MKDWGMLGMEKVKAMAVRRLVRGLPRWSSYDNGQACAGCQHGEVFRFMVDKLRSAYLAGS
ncbi:hypothetical protein KSP40_PGU010490 [Platanthera guangdongensis]|uniref:Uncharacterized protein n=1 Tax=Platanthera guangdongensis TaxID=2320717 RepID=A0ABR2LBI4_9ASPA